MPPVLPLACRAVIDILRASHAKAEDEVEQRRQKALQADSQRARQAQAGVPPPQPGLRKTSTGSASCAGRATSSRPRSIRSKRCSLTEPELRSLRPCLAPKVVIKPVTAATVSVNTPKDSAEDARSSGKRQSRRFIASGGMPSSIAASEGDFRALWIVRINAAAREHGISYSKLIASLDKAGIAPGPQDPRGSRHQRSGRLQERGRGRARRGLTSSRVGDDTGGPVPAAGQS